LIKELPSLVPAEVDGKIAVRNARADSSDSSLTSDFAVAQAAVVADQQQHGDKTGENSVDENNAVDDTAVDQKQALGKSPGEIAFFKLLHSEFKKATHFFDRAQQEFSIRVDRVTEGMEIMKRPNSIMVNEKWSMLAKSIFRLYKDLLLLETFAIMTYCSFSKILKKHDKVTGHDTRGAFMANVVSKANFTTYPKVLEMITQCEHLYEEVTDRLLQEGKEGLYEDERLFINMISRLNEQALDNPDAPERVDGRRKVASSMSSASSAESRKQPESLEVSRLRSLVEENDARKTAHVSEGHEDDDEDDRKRPAVDSTSPVAKRTKV
jgi:hypothetical protein